MLPAQRHIFEDHLLSCSALLLPDGRYQSRVAITALGGGRTVAQRFLDLDSFATDAEALEQARQAGMAWVRRHG